MSIIQEFSEMEQRREDRTQRLGSLDDLSLLVTGKDVLEVRRIDYPDCAPEHFLYILNGRNDLIVWGSGVGQRPGDERGRVVKLPLAEMNIANGVIQVPNYYFNIFFKLKERQRAMLQEAGLMR